MLVALHSAVPAATCFGLVLVLVQRWRSRLQRPRLNHQPSTGSDSIAVAGNESDGDLVHFSSLSGQSTVGDLPDFSSHDNGPSLVKPSESDLLSRRLANKRAVITTFTSAPSAPSAIMTEVDSPLETPTRQTNCWRPRSLATPSSATSIGSTFRRLFTPNTGTPLPEREDLRLVDSDVEVVLFDFDGTLTASAGESAVRARKQTELQFRAPLLKPRLQALREAGLMLGIISKSSDGTVLGALEAANLRELFNGPVLCKAVGFEGKAGFVEDLVKRGSLQHLGEEGWRRVLLVDDDIRELDRARALGMQAYAAPQDGGLQEEDFDEIFKCLGLGRTLWTSEASNPSPLSPVSSPEQPKRPRNRLHQNGAALWGDDEHPDFSSK